MSLPSLRPDSDLRDLDIAAALDAGVHGVARDRTRMQGDAALAAALRLERLGVEPYGVRFLAHFVISAGRAAAVALPEPLVGGAAAALAHGWLTATLDDIDASRDTVAGDDLVGQWLRAVADLLELRERAGAGR